MRHAFIGIDVGTSSARAGVFDEKGSLLATARHPITVWHEAGSVVEQSSSEIWAACAASVRAAMAEAAIAPSAVKGVGFDATCSLVVLDAGANPLTVSSSGDERRNVIVWMDHRAIAEARQINDTQDDVLRYVGGSISPEMEIPKLLWLKRHLSSTYRSAGHFFDLADYLSFRATGSTARSICTLACKWNFLAHERRWSGSYFERIGLGDLASENYAKIGNEVVAPGTPVGAGLTTSAARDFGLLEGTPVGASLIDAHAGGVGTIGGRGQSGEPVDVCSRLAYIMGTSACIMATTSEPCFVPGVWGPYYSGMVPGFWLNEGGQSAAGGPSITSSDLIRRITRPSPRRRLPAWKSWNFSSGALSRVQKAWVRRHCLPVTSTFCPSFSATDRRSPIPAPGPLLQGWTSTSTSAQWSGCSWPGYAGLPTVLQMSSNPFDRTVWIAT